MAPVTMVETDLQEMPMLGTYRKVTQGLVWFSAIALACATLDLVTKNVVSGTLTDEARTDQVLARQVVFPPCLSLLYNHTLNKGALFSLGNQFGFQANTFFMVVSFIAVVSIVGWALWPGLARTGFQTFTLAVVLGGALGNLHDRWFYGGVRDWIWVYYERMNSDGRVDYPFNWPVFNLADCFLVGGAALLIIQGLFAPGPNKSAASPSSAPFSSA